MNFGSTDRNKVERDKTCILSIFILLQVRNIFRKKVIREIRKLCFLRNLVCQHVQKTNVKCNGIILLFLQEPTSGLDSSTAYNLCLTIKKFAKISRKTVIMTIHQPSSKIFNMFDKLVLLCDGNLAYYGDVRHCARYFSSIDLKCPDNYNLADHIRKSRLF